MKLIVNPHKIEIIKEPVNEKEINISKCEFEFAEEITDDYVKEAYFTFKGTTYKELIIGDECSIPYEVLAEKGQIELGVVAFLVDGDEEIKRYNPSPAYFNSWVGSLKEEFENSEPVTPSDKEQMEQALQDGLNDISEAVANAENLDIDVNKVDNKTTVTITKQDGTTKSEEILDGVDGTDGQDGVSLQYNWSGTNLGIKREDEANYEYVNLKGDTGEPGQIEFIVVNELPSTGNEGTIYLVPLDTPESGENNYAEYIYVNDEWELLGKIGVHIDLSNYYTKQEVNNLIPDELSDLADDSTHRLVTDTEKTTWNGKYDKPNGGIPSTDLASAVQTSLGKADTAIQSSDLTNYVQNTDYATNNVGGVIKTSDSFSTGKLITGELVAGTVNYALYNSGSNARFISKGTLENVITGKGLVSNTDYASSSTGGVIKSNVNGFLIGNTGNPYVNSYTYEQYINSITNSYFISKGTLENVLNARIGDIATALDTINGEVVD